VRYNPMITSDAAQRAVQALIIFIFSGIMNKLLFLLVIAVLGFFHTPSYAIDSPASAWVKTDYTEVRLISAVTNVGDKKQIPLGLHFKLKEGWKIYWRSPGDAGFSPRLSWTGSTNLAAADILWPAPKRFSVLGFDTQGYKDEVVFPLRATLLKSGEALNAHAKIDYLACKEICIPYRTKLSLALSSGPSNTSAHAHLINRFQALVPGEGQGLGIVIKDAYVSNLKTKPVLTVIASSTTPFKSPDLFVEGSRDLQFGKPKIATDKAKTETKFTVPVFGLKDLKGGPQSFVNRPITITLVDNKRSLEKKLNVTAGPKLNQSNVQASDTIWQIILFALLGGFILNLMPCVLPVLSIKLLGVVSHGGRDKKDVRLSFIASAAGIIFSLLMIAAGLLLLKSAGMSIGWGIQFQHPWFLIMMAVVVTLFACNLWGFFDITLPRWIADAGSHSGQAQGLGEHFSTGMLATLLATPCSAPFLGTAIGFALSRGAFEIWMIFTALGVGLALPYILIALAPGLASRLPRPGAWMVVLRKILGFALALTTVWLLSVLQSFIGLIATSICALLLLTITIILLLRQRQSLETASTTGSSGWKVVSVLTVLVFAVPLWFAKIPDASTSPNKDSGTWTRFDESKISLLVNEGKTVFVDVTANWCITCQVNKKLVLDSAAVDKMLSNDNIVRMKADWTHPNKTIAEYLAKFGRYGIPFNVVYGPSAPSGITLPELLTNSAVLGALKQAQQKTSLPATARR
jgi:suppressor for copper-sensitivity B